MLKDRLVAVSEGSPKKGFCLLGEEMRNMDADTFSAFVRAMKSSASSAQIMEILKDEGISSFGITHLRDKRRQCFKEDGGCFCLKEIENAK